MIRKYYDGEATSGGGGEQPEERITSLPFKQSFEDFEELTVFIQQMASSGMVPHGSGWTSFLYELNKVCSAARLSDKQQPEEQDIPGDVPTEELKRIKKDAEEYRYKSMMGGFGLSIFPAEVYIHAAKAEYLLHLSQKKEPVLRWVKASERSPNSPGWYHTNVGRIEWGCGNEDEYFWLNRFGGHVNEWLESLPADTTNNVTK